MTLERYLAEQQKKVDDALDARVPPETAEPRSIHKAMR